MAGYRLQDTADTRNALLDVLERGASALFRMPFAHRLLRVGSTADGSRVFVMDNVRAISVIDPVRRRVIGSYSAEADFLDAVTPDGRAVVVGGPAPGSSTGTGQISVLDGHDGALIRVLPVLSDDNHGPAPVLTGDGRWLAVAEAADAQATRVGARVALFDAHDWASPPRILTLASPVRALAAGRDRLVVATADGTIRVVATAALTTIAAGRQPALADAARAGTPESTAVSPDGSRVAVSANAVGLFDTTSLAQPARPVSSRGDVLSLGFSPDGTELGLTSSSGTVEVYSTSTQLRLTELTGHSGPALALTWSAGPSLYTVGLDSELIAWDVRTGSRLVIGSGERVDLPTSAERFGNQIVGVTPDQDSSRSVAAERLFDLDVGSGTRRASDDREAVVSTAADRVAVFTLDTGRMEREFTVRFAGPASGRLTVIPWQIDPNGRMLLAGYDPGPTPSSPSVRGSASNADGPTDQRLGLLDLHTGRMLAQVGLGYDYATAVGWSHDRRMLAVGSYGGELALYDSSSLTRVADAGVAHSGWILSASFSPDDSTLVTGGTDGMSLWSSPGLLREGDQVVSPTEVGSGWWYAWFAPDGTVRGLEPRPDLNGVAQEEWFTFPGSPSAWAAAACRLTAADMTPAQWARYLAPRPYETVCPR